VQDPAAFHLVDAAGQVVPHQALDGFHRFETEVGKSSHLYVVRAALSLESLPACGYRVYYAVRGPAPALPGVEAPVRITERGMENRYLHVEIRPDGTLDVLDKESGRTFHELGYYVDDEDAGDTYDYSPCPSPERLSTRGEPASIRRLHAGPLQAAYEIAHAWALPASLTSDRQRRSAERVPFPITTTITLRHDSRRLELRTTVDNRARDHRLRVHVPTGINTDTAHADGHFDVLARSIDLPTGAGWDQPPVPTRHQRYFVDLSDGETGLAVLNRGLAEYEVLRDGGHNTVAITLLRCVGYLSRGDGDMPTRPNLAGPPLPTPEAQCPGTHTFDYALVFHPGDWRAIYRDACRYRAPLYVRRGDEHPGYSPTSADIEVWGAAALPRADLHGDLAGELSFLSVLPAPVALSAVKRDARDERLVVRLYNPGEQGVEAELRMFLPARGVWEVNLNEEIVREFSIPGAATAIRVPIAGKEVKTLALALDTRATPARP
ncbi:MAG: glycoside hydrolase family 38 C-terminal domain-containing protein, partial [Anaerolineae bacterium]